MKPSPALSESWWVIRRNQTAVRGALEGAFLFHWTLQVERAFYINRQRGAHPFNWSEFASSLAAGGQASETSETVTPTGLPELASPVGQMAMAQALGCELRDLVPSIAEWLSGAVAQLLEGNSDMTAIAAYVDFRLSFEPNGAPDEQALGLLRSRHSSYETEVALGLAIRQVAAQLDRVLLADEFKSAEGG